MLRLRAATPLGQGRQRATEATEGNEGSAGMQADAISSRPHTSELRMLFFMWLLPVDSRFPGSDASLSGCGLSAQKALALIRFWRTRLARIVRSCFFKVGTHRGSKTRASGRAQSRGSRQAGREAAPTCCRTERLESIRQTGLAHRRSVSREDSAAPR